MLLRSSGYVFVQLSPDEVAMLKKLHTCCCSCHIAVVRCSVNRCHGCTCRISFKQAQYPNALFLLVREYGGHLLGFSLYSRCSEVSKTVLFPSTG
jgi:hypothetical protein